MGSLAAVPVEESVQDSASPTFGQPRTATSSRPRSLDIPPTIEPAAPAGGTGTASASLSSAPVAPTLNADTGSGGELGQLFYQLQVLQQEIQTLRGQVEEQDYIIKRLQRDQKEQYLDLDKRVVALYNNEPAPAPSATVPQAPRVSTGGSASPTERQAYETAFDAMRRREFEASLMGFRSLIENFPNGQYTPNAYYWIGELHLAAQSEPELARQSFMQVVSLYPDHQKMPDALYKLGVVYHTLGDTAEALEYLNKVQQQYPNTSAAGLAAKYAAELQ
ncbi:MAG: tol-pal system protein YbgF [Pseudomonadota bacterium]